MKTPTEHAKHILEEENIWEQKLGPFLIKQDMLEHIIAEIQRDAREGMVPVEDIRSIVTTPADNCNCDWCKGVRAFRAKHPELFTI